MTQPTADAERFDQMLACADSDAHKEPSRKEPYDALETPYIMFSTHLDWDTFQATRLVGRMRPAGKGSDWLRCYDDGFFDGFRAGIMSAKQWLLDNVEDSDV